MTNYSEEFSVKRSRVSQLPTVCPLGRRGDWYANVPGFGRLACLHEDFRRRGQGRASDWYCQPTANHSREKAEQAEWLHQTGYVCMTNDTWHGPPSDPYHRCKRKSYIAIYRVIDPRYENCKLTFTFAERVAHCR